MTHQNGIKAGFPKTQQAYSAKILSTKQHLLSMENRRNKGLASDLIALPWQFSAVLAVRRRKSHSAPRRQGILEQDP
ncbi:hypothetical protein [Massilia sp. X63]|uniref:hypothetical protein n=1 Tax=Massilia sp. X63 TaxID=3237285 RepID=UPI0034DD9CCC